ncbi:golgin subfamily B member 1 isoform X2 [Gouania willdenowi]|uniref:golgin subfamily B member 1 isoform X2 n=1 Tax=Gouania willdenowi TaxID=441366 RepID=UPI0010556D45|nr:golgin subfamily B member 1-like isoform X2 [Gouania willdenowi]
MLKWFSAEEGGEPGVGGPGSAHPAAPIREVAVEELAERLSQTEQLVSQLKELIREKDAVLRSKDDQLKVEKEACEAKLSKLRLQNKAKVTSLNTQLEELRKQQGGPATPTHGKKGTSDGAEQASRGKIVLLKKKVEELEQQVAQRNQELENKKLELESRRQRGEEMDVMLTEKDRKLAEKEAYIVHLQTALAGDQPISSVLQLKAADDEGSLKDLQLLVESLTKKVGESEEHHSLLQEQNDSLKELLSSEQEQFTQKENMYKQNIQTFKDIIIQKDNQLMEVNQMHEQELFRLAAKSDASADLEQLLKALKQKLHEKEEVLRGKTQVIDVFQGEVDSRDDQIRELMERLRRLQVERESLASKMEAEKHVMRAQLRDLMEKHQGEVTRLSEQHQLHMEQTQQELRDQLEQLRRTSALSDNGQHQSEREERAESVSVLDITELQAQAKLKSEEASRSEAKFLKIKAWSKNRIRQLEEELKKSLAGVAPPDVTALRSRVTELEEEREENQWRVEQYEELKVKNEMLAAKLVVYEEQQRTLQADLEQFTKRAASQASESGSADDTQSQLLEWQEMVTEASSARDRAQEEKTTMALRISHMEEEREGLIEDDWFFPGCSDPALVTRQQELEEELAQTRGLGQHRAKKLGSPGRRSLQEDFEFEGQTSFQDPRSHPDSSAPMEGENMGGGLRSVVEELELERNQLQEQILSLEDRCQDLEDRLQLQARIESLQNESEKLQSQLASVRSQQSRDAEKHQLVVSSLNEQLKGLNDTQECLESSLMEKENTLAKTTEKLELINSLQESLSEKENQHKELSERLVHTEHTLESVSTKCSSSEKQCLELKAEVVELTEKLNVVKEKTQKQESTIESLQTDLDQTNEELDKINSTHLEERAQLIHDLQSREREIDSLRDVILEKDTEISTLSGNMAEYAEQVSMLKQELKLKEESLVCVENALSKAEREATVIKESQSSDQQALNSRITDLVGKLKDAETEFKKAKEERETKEAEVEHLIMQVETDQKTMQELQGEIQRHTVSHRNHLSECESLVTSLKEQLVSSARRLEESEGLLSLLQDKNTSQEKLQEDFTNKEQMYKKEIKASKEEQNNLLVQLEKSKSEVQTLCKQLEEHAQANKDIKKSMQGKMETIATLENQLKESNQHYECEKQNFTAELQNKSTNISQLEDLLHKIKMEKEQLQDELKDLSEELQLQKQNNKELNEKMNEGLQLNRSLEDQVHHLKQEKETLLKETTEAAVKLSALVAEMDSLQLKMSTLETKHSESSEVIKELEKDKECLTARMGELTKVIEQSTHSNSEMLLEKTNECSNLNQLLREKEEEMILLQQQIQTLSGTVEGLQCDVAEREQIVVDLRARSQSLQSQQAQLEETLSQLRQQECSLKSMLTEKEEMLREKQEEFRILHDETRTQKDIATKLQAEAEALSKECSQLRQQLESKIHEAENSSRAQKNLNDKISVMEENAKKQQSELENLTMSAQTLSEENLKLHSACESRKVELNQSMNTVSDLNDQLRVALDQNLSLSEKIVTIKEDNQKLQEELGQSKKSIFELGNERNVLLERCSNLQNQTADDQKTINGLLTQKEELLVNVNKLQENLKESEQSMSGLLKKMNECATLSDMLQQKEKHILGLQEHVTALQTQLSQLKESLNDKEQRVTEQTCQMEAQQNQITQLEDTISMLQEQGVVLKSGLMEKDAILMQTANNCEVYQSDLSMQKELIAQLQLEVDSLRKENSEEKLQIEKKNQVLKETVDEMRSYKDELNKQNEFVLSLSGQLGAMNESTAEKEAEIINLALSVQKLTEQNSQLIQDGEQKKVEIIDFKDNIQALNEQNARLKSELQKTVLELSKAHEQVTNFQTTISERNGKFQAESLEKEKLIETLKEKQALIQQLNDRNMQLEEEVKHKAIANDHLQTQVKELEGVLSDLKGQLDNLTSESYTLKNTLEIKEKSSLEYQNHSAATIKNLNMELQAKDVQCESLKEQVSQLKESVEKLNCALQVEISKVENLKKTVENKDEAMSAQTNYLQIVQRQVDEGLLLRTKMTESTELVSQLQSRLQQATTESKTFQKSAEEMQNAFKNLQEKYAANTEDLQNTRSQLSLKIQEVSNLTALLDESSIEHQAVKTTIESLRKELIEVNQNLEETKVLNSNVLKKKDEALSSHQVSISQLTVEIEKLRSQHLQVAEKMNALTENLEQREMALHAINNQYNTQAKQASELASELQKVKGQNKSLTEEVAALNEEHQKLYSNFGGENTQLQEEVGRLLTEKRELEKSRRQLEEKCSSMSEMIQQAESETQTLQAKVSVKDEEVSQLKERVRKTEQILQDSEREWLSVLDRERNVLAEQMKSVENEMEIKDVKFTALKQDLDGLQEKLAEASSAVQQGSDQLNVKEMEASASRVQLEKVLASIQEKKMENNNLKQTLKTAEEELQRLIVRKYNTGVTTLQFSFNEEMEIKCLIKALQDCHQAEVDVLNVELSKTVANLMETESSDSSKGQQITLLQETIGNLQTQLNAEIENAKGAAVEHSSPHDELRGKEKQISFLSSQISQQVELLAGLSQQLKEKDASVAQIIESASNERMKREEEKCLLLAELESVTQARQVTEKRLEEISQQLDEHLLYCQREMEAVNSEKVQLIKEKGDLKNELAKLSKATEATKKKLQAALVVRKDLLKKIEAYEKQIKDQTEFEEKMCSLEKKLQVKEEEIHHHKIEREKLVEQLLSEKHTLEVSLSEAEESVRERESLLDQLQFSAAQKTDTFQRDQDSLRKTVGELQDELQKCKEELQVNSSFSATAVDLENKLEQLKSEKVMLQKKVQAALLARRETLKKAQENEKQLTQEVTELKDDYKALLEQHCQQTNKLNDMQLSAEEKVRELEELRKATKSHLEELDTFRYLVQEKDQTLQDLQMSLAEKERQCDSLSNLPTELEVLNSRCESFSLELANKEKALKEMEQREGTLKSQLNVLESDLEKAKAEVKEKMEAVEKYERMLKETEHENQPLLDKIYALENELKKCALVLDECNRTNEEKCKILMDEKEALLKQCDQVKVELEETLALVLLKSSDISSIEKLLAETQQQHKEAKDILTKELEKVQLQCCDIQRNLDLLKQEKENCVGIIGELGDEVTTLKNRLKKYETLQEVQVAPVITLAENNKCEVCTSPKCVEIFDAKLKEREAALFVLEAQVMDKDRLISALEQQLQQQINKHEAAVEKMRVEAQELQKSRDEGNRLTDQDSQSKVALLTRKLHAALGSRRELLKESAALKDELDKLSSKNKAKEEECSTLESRVLHLKQLNMDLESSVLSVTKEKNRLNTEVDRILYDNHNLSAACDSLKLTIEDITQQKRAFSCQLESLKDSQTDELSNWKSKHAELKQEYESLLQAYENVSSEMNKMRQLLEGSKRERQEAVRNLHKQEAEMERLDKHANELEVENERLKERVHQTSKKVDLKIEELEKENQEIRNELMALHGNHKLVIRGLSDEKLQLEAEICLLKKTSEEFQMRFTEIQAENNQLMTKLEEANFSVQKKVLDSSSYTNIQLKLDEALDLNNSLTAQIKAQKTELAAQMEINNLLQKEKQHFSDKIENLLNDHELQLGKQDETIKDLKDIIDRHSQETISLNEKVRILEDDKSLLQEELENIQEISDKVKNENEYLETAILKSSERIDELTESGRVLQTQNAQLSAQLTATQEMSNQVRHEKEQEQLKLVRELEEKLKKVQRGNEGTKNVKKELQELLKEKHQEINQLQQNCIRYQELILDLENSLKSSQSAFASLEKDFKKCSKILASEEEHVHCKAELIRHKALLQEAEEKIAGVQSERDDLAHQLSQQSKQMDSLKMEKTQSLHNIDEMQLNAYVENHAELQRQIEDLKHLKIKESQRVSELRQQLDSQDLQINTLNRVAKTNETKLSALSSTVQGAEATKLWNELFEKTLQQKDDQLLEQGLMIKRFLEDMRGKEKEVNELRVVKSRLERTLNEYSVAAAAQQRQLFILSASNVELSEKAELMTIQLKELSAQVERTERDKIALTRQLADKVDATSQMQLTLQQLEKINADADAELLHLHSENDKIQAECEKQEGICLQLKTLLQSKDAEIDSLLSCKDGELSGYLEQLQSNYHTQLSVYEDRLTSLRYKKEKADRELRLLEAKVKSQQVQVERAIKEKEHIGIKFESFKSSMVSLQNEREQLMSEHRILKAKNQLGLVGKDGLAEGESGATKGLKHEIRKLLHQMDDLNSENAMLRAQLVRYREDLNQVLSLKDNQLKVLLKKQQDTIQSLEQQKSVTEKQLRDSRLDLQREEETNNILKDENSKLKTEVSRLEGELSSQSNERATTPEGKVIINLREAVAAKAVECSELQQKLLSQKSSTDELKSKIQQQQKETENKLSEAEDEYNGHLHSFEREMNLMRTERETADQRVADLSADLLETEQQLTKARAQSKDLKTQNESLCKAMAALQNDRDQLIEDFKILRNRYDEELRKTQAALYKAERSLQDTTSELAMFAKEKDILIHKLKAFESKDVPAELNKLLDELSKALSEKEKELKLVVSENTAFSRQLSAFSKSMASLQNDRDRLMDELVGAKRVAESRQGSSTETVISQSMDIGVGAFLSEPDQPVEQEKQTADDEHRESLDLRSTAESKELLHVKETVASTFAGANPLEEAVNRLNAERMHLHGDLQRCMFEIQQRDHYLQQLNTKLQLTMEEKEAAAAQLTTVTQTLRHTQDRCHWLESRVQGQSQAEVAPGAPQEKTSDSIMSDSQLRERLLEVELSLSDERARRETVEEALRLAEDTLKSVAARDFQQDFSIEMDPEEEWDALSLNPSQPLVTRKVKGGMVACRQWFRGRSLYFSRLLTTRARSRYFFLVYLLSIHVLLVLCFTGAL